MATTYDPNGATPAGAAAAVSAQPNDTSATSPWQGMGGLYAHQGGGLLDAAGNTLLNNQVAGAATTSNDVPALMNGVGANGSQGMLKDSAGGGGAMGTSNPDLAAAIQNRSNDALANTVNSIRTTNDLNSPVRLAQRQAQAEGSLAENEQLRFNNWTLQNNMDIQQAQLQANQDAAEAQYVGSVLGVMGKVFGAVVGA